MPEYNDDGAKAWLYGKLLVVPLAEKLIRHASALSPRVYGLPPSWARGFWRDFAFVWNQDRWAIEPAVPLAETLGERQVNLAGLAGNPHNRQPQPTRHFGLESSIVSGDGALHRPEDELRANSRANSCGRAFGAIYKDQPCVSRHCDKCANVQVFNPFTLGVGDHWE